MAQITFSQQIRIGDLIPASVVAAPLVPIVDMLKIAELDATSEPVSFSHICNLSCEGFAVGLLCEIVKSNVSKTTTVLNPLALSVESQSPFLSSSTSLNVFSIIFAATYVHRFPSQTAWIFERILPFGFRDVSISISWSFTGLAINLSLVRFLNRYA